MNELQPILGMPELATAIRLEATYHELIVNCVWDMPLVPPEHVPGHGHSSATALARSSQGRNMSELSKAIGLEVSYTVFCWGMAEAQVQSWGLPQTSREEYLRMLKKAFPPSVMPELEE